MEKFDIIVAGAGTGGSSAAKTAAKAGFHVCLIDAKTRENIGKKVCGDAIGKHHFDNLGLKEPAAKEIERVMEGIEIFSPDLQTKYVVKGEQLYGYILNRHRFGQRLLKDALDAGAVLRDETYVLDPVIKQGSVCGVVTKSQKTGETETLQSPLVIEATGFFATIRKKLTPEFGIETEVDKKDVEACYREIRKLRVPQENPTLCQIYITQMITPGGYYWIFPEGGTKVNVGLGVAMTKNFPNPKVQLYKHVLSQPLFDGAAIVEKGAWFVPTRRPLDNMVGNGILIVGDAACQVNPIHGGGIGPSMMAGFFAGKAAGQALENGDFSREALWGYNVDYIRNYGAKQASLEVFRIFLQNMDDEELNYGMSKKLLTEEDVLSASLGEDIHFTISEKLGRAVRGLKKLNVIRKLKTAANAMNEIKEWYRQYPASPRGFETWKLKTKAFLKNATIKLQK